MPLRLRSKGRHGRRIHQAQRIEATVGEPREGVGAAGDRRIETAQPNGIRRLADRDRARRAGGDDARALAFEAVAMRDDIDGRAGEVIPRLRRPRPIDAIGEGREEIVFVANQIGGARRRASRRRASRSMPESSSPESCSASSAATTPSRSERDQRRHCSGEKQRGQLLDRHFAGNLAAIAGGVEGGHRPDAAGALEHSRPGGFPRQAERADDPNPGNRHAAPRSSLRLNRCRRSSRRCLANTDSSSRRICATAPRSRALPRSAATNGMN